MNNNQFNNSEEKEEKIPPVHPGRILKNRFFDKRNLSLEEVAKDILVPLSRLEDLIENRIALDNDMAYRLSFYFEIEPSFFLKLQQFYDLDIIRYQGNKNEYLKE